MESFLSAPQIRPKAFTNQPAMYRSICVRGAALVRHSRNREILQHAPANLQPQATAAAGPSTTTQTAGGLLHSPGRWFAFGSNAGHHDGDGSIHDRLTQAGDRGDLTAVLAVIEEQGRHFDAAGVEAALAQVERCARKLDQEDLEAVHANKSFQLLADMAVSICTTSPPELLARTIAAMGRLKFSDQLVLDELSRSLMASVHQLDPHHLQQVAEGLRLADHSPGVLLLDAIDERLKSLGGEVQQQHADAIRADLKSLGHDESNPATPPPQRQPERIKYT